VWVITRLYGAPPTLPQSNSNPEVRPKNTARIHTDRRDSSVGITTGYRLDGRGSNLAKARFFSSPQRLERFRGPHTIISNGYGGRFDRGKISRGVKLSTQLRLVARSRMMALHFHSSICLHGVMLNNISRGTTLYILSSTCFHSYFLSIPSSLSSFPS
jgi:hypothetical protein